MSLSHLYFHIYCLSFDLSVSCISLAEVSEAKRAIKLSTITAATNTMFDYRSPSRWCGCLQVCHSCPAFVVKFPPHHWAARSTSMRRGWRQETARSCYHGNHVSLGPKGHFWKWFGIWSQSSSIRAVVKSCYFLASDKRLLRSCQLWFGWGRLDWEQ